VPVSLYWWYAYVSRHTLIHTQARAHISKWQNCPRMSVAGALAGTRNHCCCCCCCYYRCHCISRIANAIRLSRTWCNIMITVSHIKIYLLLLLLLLLLLPLSLQCLYVHVVATAAATLRYSALLLLALC
jgi:hypothetical protein